MKLKTIIFLLPIFLFFFTESINGQNSKEKTNIDLPKISKEIEAMRGPDQKLRKKYVRLIKKGKTATNRFKKVRSKLVETDRNNTARMKQIVEKYGWPTYDAVGKKASNTAWLIVQHADRNPFFQMSCLPLLKEAVDNNQANPENYAYLYDRVQLAQGRKQMYATQSTRNKYTKEVFFQSIEDESNVQKRRSEVGLRSIIEYAQSLDFEYEIPSKKEAVKRAEKIKKSYDTNLKLAIEAMKNKDYEAAIKYYTLVNYCDGYTKTEDYINLARAISFSESKDYSWGIYFIRKAVVRGWEGQNNLDSNKDFENIKKANLSNWKELMDMINSMNN